jgi:hypothetical protein
VVTTSQTVAAQSRATILADQIPGLEETAFSSVVTSHLGLPVVAERTMRWNETGYGSHTEKAAESPARTWYFAEGSQGFFDTFFLFTNPAPVASAVTLQFLLEGGTTVTRTYGIGPQARLTVHAGGIDELLNQSFGTVATFAIAGVAERAMYFGTPTFNAGHESAGVRAPSRDWFLAEGATGDFFTTFVLLANPGSTPATITMTYLREGGGEVTRTRTLAAHARLTINVATEDASLAATSVATRVSSDVPIVVERAQYWPFLPTEWQEAHNSFGVTQTALRWGLAEGRTGGPEGYQTYVLLANPDSAAASVTLTFLRIAGGSPITKTVSVPPNARRTVSTGPGTAVPELTDEEFGVVVTADRPIFVERAMYSNANGTFWAAGSNATATPIP